MPTDTATATATAAAGTPVKATVHIANVDLPLPPKKYVNANLANATAGGLVDEVALIRKWMNYFKSADAFLSAALKVRLDDKTTAHGDMFTMSRETYQQQRISPDLCREHLTPEQLELVTVTTDVTQMRFSPKD
jgi:hypothetical protein